MKATETNFKLVSVQQKDLVQFQLLLDEIDWCMSRRLLLIITIFLFVHNFLDKIILKRYDI